jgi:D-alanyl-D-alanine carboxypeptidase
LVCAPTKKGVATHKTKKNANAQFAIASVGKAMTAVAILQLVEKSHLNLNTPVTELLNIDVTNGLGGLKNMKLHHLLTMTSGLPDYYDDSYLDDASMDQKQIQTPEVAITYAFSHKRLFPPGEDFHYSNTNYLLLQMILERASGVSMSTYFKRHIFKSTKMRDSFVFGCKVLPSSFVSGREGDESVRDYYQGQGFGDGGVVSTAPDVVRFYKALFLDKKLLHQDTLRVFLRDTLSHQYGMGIETEPPIYGHSGGDLGFSSDVKINMDTSTIAVLLIAKGDADTNFTFDWVQSE